MTGTLMSPASSKLVNLAYRRPPISRFAGTWTLPYTCTSSLSDVILSLSIASASTITILPPGARTSYAAFCVSADEIASYATLTGLSVIALTEAGRSASGALRSMMCVAPSDLRYASFRFEAVVMMGEKPESFANWITNACSQHFGESRT